MRCWRGIDTNLKREAAPQLDPMRDDRLVQARRRSRPPRITSIRRPTAALSSSSKLGLDTSLNQTRSARR
jgi:hypothetical protein